MIDLTQFTNPFDLRTYCRKPIVLSTGMVVATDGATIMALDKYDGDVSVIPQAPKDIEAAITKHLSMIDQLQDWRPISSLPLPVQEPCSICNGSGRVNRVECDECDGAGEFLHGSHYYDCKACDGSGEAECSPAAKDSRGAQQCHGCHGTGQSTAAAFMKIDGLPAGFGVDSRLLARYPADGEYAVSGAGNKSILLCGPGWRGAMLPMRKQA